MNTVCKHFLILIGIFSFVSNGLVARQMVKTEDHIAIENEKKVMDWAQTHLSQTGVLKEGKDGFVYLKVDDNYVHQLFPLLDYPGYVEPPYFRRSDSPGAHISVFYVDERNRTGPIKEIGQTFSFKIARIALVPPHKYKEWIVMQVEAPELEKLREKYGVSPLLKNHEFHITLAKRRLRHHSKHYFGK